MIIQEYSPFCISGCGILVFSVQDFIKDLIKLLQKKRNSEYLFEVYLNGVNFGEVEISTYKTWDERIIISQSRYYHNYFASTNYHYNPLKLEELLKSSLNRAHTHKITYLANVVNNLRSKDISEI